MKTLEFQPLLNLQDFYRFAKMAKDEQIHELITNGVHLDTMFEDEYRTLLFFLRGFFVELNISAHNGKVLEIIPLKQGYKFEHFFQVRKVFVPSTSAFA